MKRLVMGDGVLIWCGAWGGRRGRIAGLCLFLLILFGACANDGSSSDAWTGCPTDPLSGCSDSAPLAGDPRYGLVAQILIQDNGCSSEDGRRDCLWIGIDDPAVLEQIRNRGGNLGGDIRGDIIAAPSQPHGFYINPASTLFWDGGLLPEVVTTIDRTEADPAFYEGGPYAPYAFWADTREIVINP